VAKDSQDKTAESAGITEATGRKHDNTITRGHNEFIAGNLRTINAELLTYCFASSWVASENGRRSRPFSILRREASLPAIYCSQVLGGKEENENGGERWWSFTAVHHIMAQTVRHLHGKLRPMPWFTEHFLCFLFTKLTCPSYKLTRVWLHARNAQVKNCFLLARSLHNLSSYKRHNQLGTHKKKIHRLIIYLLR